MQFKSGLLVQWHDEKGFGFVQDAGGNRAFVHIKAFNRVTRRPVVGDALQYRLGRDAQGRVIAISVGFTNDQPSFGPRDKRAHPSRGASMPSGLHRLLGVLSGLLLAYVCMHSIIPMHVLGYLGLMSFITGLSYWLDKSFAQTKGWRTQEKTLHVFALLGGWPGAWLAQIWAAHKSRKRAFQAKFWFTVAVNLGALDWLNSSSGIATLGGVGAFVHTFVLGW